MGDTEISWTHRPGTRGRTWNPTQGCRRVSPGCEHCYAERLAARFAENGWSKGLINLKTRKWNGEARLAAHKLADPLRWREPSTVFVNSMSDLFYEGFTNEEIAAVFGVMAAAPQHTFQVLTKRAKRMREWFEWAEAEGRKYDLLAFEPRALLACAWEACAGDAWGDVEPDSRLGDLPSHEVFGENWPLPNVWLGVSVENQAAADERIPELLQTPAAVRFLSCEPLIGEVDLDLPRCENDHHGPDAWGLAGDEATPWCSECELERSYGHWLHLDGGIDWVIAGCESGPGARRCGVEWLRSLRDQCADAGVPYFLKQAVHGAEFVAGPGDGHRGVSFSTGSKRKAGGVIELPYLDGVQHAQFPGATP
jgi:protein gp37